MKTLALILASAALAPAFAFISRGARLERWPIIGAGAVALAAAFATIHYLLGG